MYTSFIRNIVLPVSDKILGLSLTNELKKWRKIQWFSREKLDEMQLSRLKDILTHCNKNVPYYKEIFSKNGYQKNGNVLDELKSIPFLTKQIIKENFPNKILCKNKKTYCTENTSGSSGEQGTFSFDKISFSITLAIQSLWWGWYGYRFGDKVLQTGITPERGIIKIIKDVLLRVKYIQAYKMDTETIRKNLKSIQGTNDYYFMGFASSLYTYAKLAQENKFDNIQFKGVVSWGDKMFPHYRKMIEKQFKTVVFDTYGACEGTMIAAECEKGSYHIMIPHVFIEILDKNGNEVKPGQIGEVIVTRLDNYLMPLIRYRIGDLAIKADSSKRCSCGRNFPMLEKIIGRTTDIVYTPQGQALIVHFFTGIFEHVPEIEQFQVVQQNGSPLEIRFIQGKNFNETILVEIKQEMYKKADERFPVNFTQVDRIYPSPSGKPQIVVKE